MAAAPGRDCIAPGVVSRPCGVPTPYASVAFAAANIPAVRQLPEQCACCGRQIATLDRCILPDGTRKRGAEVTFRESAEGGVRCTECASQRPPHDRRRRSGIV